MGFCNRSIAWGRLCGFALGQTANACRLLSHHGPASGGDPGPTLDLTCGPEKPKTATLEYEPHADAQIGTIGIVKSLEFQ
jgi:hypothetical protein